MLRTSCCGQFVIHWLLPFALLQVLAPNVVLAILDAAIQVRFRELWLAIHEGVAACRLAASVKNCPCCSSSSFIDLHGS